MIRITRIISCLVLLYVNSFANAQKDIKDYEFIRTKGKVNPAMVGYWKSVGGGYIIHASIDTVMLYSFTTNFCYKEKNDYAEGLLNTQARFRQIKDTLSILMTDYGDRSEILQIKSDFVRISDLPKGTLTFAQMTALGPKKLFDLFIETMKENYAFSKERSLDWKSIREVYSKKINDNTSNDQLFRILGDIVTLTKDHHTKIISESGETLQYRGQKSADLVTATFKQQHAIKDQNAYFDTFFKSNYNNISDSLLHGNGKKAVNGQIEWGSLNRSVGYIHIHAFTNFAPKKFSRKQQIDSLYTAMEEIINSLKDKDALIVDVSFNFGGYDAAFLAMAGFFTDKPTFVYTAQEYLNGRFSDESKVFVYPSGKIQYTKPVYLLTTDISRSAAEGFAMAMKALPQVKLVGTNTLGILSGMLGKSIGNFYATSSNQRLLDPQGKFYEVTGVIPDINMDVFSKENIFGGHKDAVRKIVSMIEANSVR